MAFKGARCLPSRMEKNAYETMSRRIKEILKDTGITQKKLAELTGMQEGYLSELLKCHEEKRWNADHITIIANALQVPSWYLLVDPKSVLEPGDIEIISRYHALPDHLKKAVYAILYGEK